MSNHGMIARWRMDEGSGSYVGDSSGQGHHGVLGSWTAEDAAIRASWGPGGASPTWITGRRSGTQALRFDGNGFVEIANSPALDLCVLTVEAWVKGQSGHGTPGPGPLGILVSKGAASCSFTSYGLIVRDNLGPNGLVFSIANWGENHSLGVAAKQIWNNEWHHVAGTYDGRIIRFYLDGNEVGPGIATTLTIEYNLGTNDRFYIGAMRGTCNMGFVGDVDEVRLWKGALSPSEIEARFNDQELP